MPLRDAIMVDMVRDTYTTYNEFPVLESEIFNDLAPRRWVAVLDGGDPVELILDGVGELEQDGQFSRQ